MLVLSGENQRHLWISLDSNKKIHREAEQPGDRPGEQDIQSLGWESGNLGMKLMCL